MGKMMFGRDELVTCITDVELQGAEGEPLCLAYKTTKHALVAPMYLSDDGYVLGVKASKVTKYYPMPEGQELRELQAEGLIPARLPEYEIPVVEYVFGHFLWIALAIGLGLTWLSLHTKKRRHASLQTSAPPETTPPRVATDLDRWVAEEAEKLLEAGEQLQHQAYGLDREVTSAVGAAVSNAAYAVLTNRRLLFIKTRVGAFGPLKDNRGVEEYRREAVSEVFADERHLEFVFHDGSLRHFYVEWSERKLSNQRRFLRDVPRLLSMQAEPAPVATSSAA